MAILGFFDRLLQLWGSFLRNFSNTKSAHIALSAGMPVWYSAEYYGYFLFLTNIFRRVIGTCRKVEHLKALDLVLDPS